MRMLFGILIVSILFLQNGTASEVQNIEQNIKELGFDKYYFELRRMRNKEKIKIAILDYGFNGYSQEKGYTISKHTELKINPNDGNAVIDENTHGLSMAQILTQYMTNNYTSWTLAPKIYLYKSNGYSNFQWAINDAIQNDVDIILHSIVIEYGSNYDGEGFHNALVNKATDAGIIWINSAGNFGLTTYNTTAKTDGEGWVQMNDIEEDALPINCEFPEDGKARKAMNKKCNIRIVLAWDDFKNQPNVGTTKDFDLYLFGKDKKFVMSSTLAQVDNKDKNYGSAGYTLYPREIIQTQVREGTSYVKVKSNNKDLVASQKIRITVDGDYISLPNRDKNESLLNPADNPNVITVGENTERSSVSRSLGKPELIAPSIVKGDDGKVYMGSSNAAAVVAAGVGLMKGLNPNLEREDILEATAGQAQSSKDIKAISIANNFIPKEADDSLFVQSDGSPVQELPKVQVVPKYRIPNPYAIPLKVLNYGPPPGVGCFPLADIKAVEACTIANFIIKSHSLLVVTTAGLKIATSFDPIKLIPGDERQDLRDVIAILPTEENPFRRFPRQVPLPRGAVEIFKAPIDEAICKIPDWDFLMTEMEISRRRVYAANSVGAYNNYIPRNCDPAALVSVQYPVSGWEMYPILQQSPYISPVGPIPIQSPHGYEQQRIPPRSNEGNGQKNFQVPNPRDG